MCCTRCRLSRYDCLIQIASDMDLVDYLLTQRKVENIRVMRASCLFPEFRARRP